MVKDAMESIYTLLYFGHHWYPETRLKDSETVSLHREGVLVEGSINTHH